ncbi:ABC transporter ATP-binding protein [Salinimicrobium marinum]|uniref:ABC transporter ATP-binding protein n=1 Tax=Salinimicrobium marinum TaxID=680283 RepID=A0A918SJM4_9FLAO|nr:ABC transporter ATP-binding protein [Salinimicrobium marinum]GHA46969.1 ABC transporter ATP-binding protein [Salinimicrobium marinum]
MLKVKKISFGYSKKLFIKNLSFNVQKGENVSIIGASGCGKSTLLQIIYGLHHVKGQIFWNEKELLGPNFNIVPGEEFIKYLTQDFDLMPPLTVAENVGKFLSNMYPRKKQQRVKELLELVEMADMAKVKAKFLSGGQQQRVALARVLAKPPEILLLDEPFSHIDHFRKNNLRRNLFSYLKAQNITCLVATHDSTDALSFADKTLAMRAGKIIAEGSPEELYRKPKNVYVASLFGEVNELPTKQFFPHERLGEKVILYPHEIEVGTSAGVEVRVKNSYFKGQHFLIEAEINGEKIFFESSEKLQPGRIMKVIASENLIRSRLGNN